MTALIVGLGNLGEMYERTRHNIGARVVKEFAERQGFILRRKLLLKAKTANGSISGQNLILLIPATYMNVSGPVVAGAMRKYRIRLEQLLVLVDDITLLFGELRLKGSGGTGGHNGLKSIEESLETQQYARLRIGVGDRTEGDLTDYVLSPFTDEEEKLVPSVLEQAIGASKLWLDEGLNRAMNSVNRSLR